MEVGWTEIAGRPVRARRTLEEPSLPGVTVVALPGLGLSGDYLLPLAHELAPSLRTYVLDVPGAGGSPGPAGRLGAAHLGEVVGRWLADNDLADVVLFGNSYGSEVAVETALRDGSRVRCVVLGAPTPDPAARSFPRQLARLLVAAARAPRDLRALAARDYVRTGARRLLQESRAALDEPIVERLGALSAPALVVRGARDPVVPQAWAERAARLAGAELVVVPEAAHGAPYVRPAAVAAAIVDFTARIAERRPRGHLETDP